MNRSFVIQMIFAFELAGCAANGNSQPPIHHRGDIVAQGVGQLSFRSQAPGLVSVYDINANSVICSTAVLDGSVVSLNPTAANIAVTDAGHGGTQIIHTDISNSHRYEIWFIPQAGATTRWTSQ